MAKRHKSNRSERLTGSANGTRVGDTRLDASYGPKGPRLRAQLPITDDISGDVTYNPITGGYTVGGSAQITPDTQGTVAYNPRTKQVEVGGQHRIGENTTVSGSVGFGGGEDQKPSAQVGVQHKVNDNLSVGAGYGTS